MNVVPLKSRYDFLHTNGELPHFCSKVWGYDIWSSGSKVHFWRCTEDGYTSICGRSIPPVIPNGQNRLFGGGTYPKCKQCMEKLRKISRARHGGGSAWLPETGGKS